MLLSHSLSHKFFSMHIHSSPLQQHDRADTYHIAFSLCHFIAHLSPFSSCNHPPVKLRTHADNQIFKTRSCFEGTCEGRRTGWYVVSSTDRQTISISLTKETNVRMSQLGNYRFIHIASKEERQHIFFVMQLHCAINNS